jgi:hypothetical protein
MPSHTPLSDATSNQPQQERWPQILQRAAINFFLIFHIVAISCWCIPTTSPLILGFKERIRPYMVWSGVFQSWDMFSPKPASANAYLEAIVIYKDGSSQLWPFPRMEMLSFTNRYFKERYRKFEENLQNRDDAVLWPDAARYIARLNTDRSNPAQKVMLVLRWSDIIPPTDSTSSDHGPWNVDVFYNYNVEPGDLQ